MYMYMYITDILIALPVIRGKMPQLGLENLTRERQGWFSALASRSIAFLAYSYMYDTSKFVKNWLKFGHGCWDESKVGIVFFSPCRYFYGLPFLAVHDP